MAILKTEVELQFGFEKGQSSLELNEIFEPFPRDRNTPKKGHTELMKKEAKKNRGLKTRIIQEKRL